MCAVYLAKVSGGVICNIFFNGFLVGSMVGFFSKKQIMCRSRAGNLHKDLIAFGPSFCGFVEQIGVTFGWIKCPKMNKPLE